MSSTGQIVGGVVGGVIGFYLGGPAGALRGAAIGASIGGYIDPPPGPNLYGPTLDDKSFQSTAYGVSIPKLHGSIATTGNIIYLENNEYKAVARKESTGGKGGGSRGSYTTTTYYATFAVALGEAMPGTSVRRIWAGGKLIYNAGSDDFQTLLQSAKNSLSWRFYDGTQTEPDSRMESVVGVGRTPSYEGTAYIIFYDFDLTPYGNGLAGCQMKVEVTPSPLIWSLIKKESLTFNRGGFYTSERRSLRPLSSDGRSTAFTWSFDQARIWTKTVEVDGATRENIKNSDYGAPIVGIGQGYSESSSYVYQLDYYFGSEYRVEWRTEKDIFRNPFFLGNSMQAAFVRIYDFGDGRPYFLCRALSTSSLFTPGIWFVWRYGDDIDDYLYDGSMGNVAFTDVVAVDGDSIALVQWGITVGAYVKVYSAIDYSLINSFNVTVPHTVNHTRPALIRDGKIYFLRSNQAVMSSGILRFSVIDIAAESIANFQLSVPGIGSTSNPDSPALSMIGSILALSYPADGNAINFYYINTASIDSLEPFSLPDFVESEVVRSGIPGSFVDVSALAGEEVFGYRFSGPGSARGALAQLQVAYLFDLVEVGYTLAAIKRGSEPDEVVPWQHLDARKSGEAPTVLIKRDYETDSQLPSRYSINYLDYNREYDTNTQYADFPSRRVNERNESVSIVMDAERAAQLADVLGNLAWMERNTFVFTVPQLYLGWLPGDVKTIELSPGNLATLRINNITYTEDQRLEINARLAEPAVYNSGAVGAPAQPPDETIPFIGVSTAVLLDIPMILDSTDIPGFVGAMYGAGSWPGGVLFRSIDNGQTYSGIQAFTGQATIGQATNALPDNSGLVIDRINSLNVQPIAGTFDAITEAQMLTGQHYCAYGVDGRWEIIRYADSVLNGDGTRTLSTLIRGYRGTEWATGLHEIGDYVVLLDDPDNAFIGSDLSQLSIERLYKPVTVGQDLASAESFEFTYKGVNLQPLSPVLPQGEIVSEDWVIEWTPRTRYSSNYWYTGTQPQNESVMAWEVDVLDGSTVVRTLSSSTPTVTYTEAQQIEDFGSAQSTITIVIYQVSQRVGRGYPLEVTF